MAPSRATASAACCATTLWCIPARSVRCGASKTTSAKSRSAWSAASRWPISRISSRATSSRRTRPNGSLPKFSPEDMAAIGVLTLELRIETSHSLKEKRHVVQSLKDRLRHKFNVSVAEIDHQDLWQRATIAAVTVSSDRENAEKVLRGVEDETVGMVGSALVETTVEWIE